MMRVLLLSLLLAACAGGGPPALTGIQASCGADDRPFVETWPCVRKNVAAHPSSDDDLKGTYISTGDVVAERIRAGQMTDAEGKLMMADTRTRLANTVQNRRAAAAGAASAGPTTYQRVGPGTVIAY